MLIALYQNHHQLPFWGGKTNPFAIFQPEVHRILPFQGPRIVEGNVITGTETITLEQEKYLFSFLVGLAAVSADGLMAHVSALCPCTLEQNGYWHYPKRVWVQISTLPTEFTNTGIPVVYDLLGKKKSEIKHVWGGDNGTGSPYGFFLKEELQEKASQDPKIWTRFFIEQLGLDAELEKARKAFHTAEKRLKSKRSQAAALQTFGQNELNLKLNVGLEVVPQE